MTETDELPEYQIFSILRKGETEPIGPYSQNQIVQLLNEGAIRPNDFVHYAELSDWKPLKDVFDLHQTITNFEDDGQDRQELADIFAAVTRETEDGENVFYIAIQDKTALRGIKGYDAVAVSDNFVWIVRHRMGGKMEIDQHSWSGINDIWAILRAGDKTGTFNLEQRSGVAIQVERIPSVQLERITTTARELLESSRDEPQ